MVVQNIFIVNKYNKNSDLRKTDRDMNKTIKLVKFGNEDVLNSFGQENKLDFSKLSMDEKRQRKGLIKRSNFGKPNVLEKLDSRKVLLDKAEMFVKTSTEEDVYTYNQTLLEEDTIQFNLPVGHHSFRIDLRPKGTVKITVNYTGYSDLKKKSYITLITQDKYSRQPESNAFYMFTAEKNDHYNDIINGVLSKNILKVDPELINFPETHFSRLCNILSFKATENVKHQHKVTKKFNGGSSGISLLSIGKQFHLGNIGSNKAFVCLSGGTQVKNLARPHDLHFVEFQTEVQTRGGKLEKIEKKGITGMRINGYRYARGIGYPDTNIENDVISHEPESLSFSWKEEMDFVCVTSKFFNKKVSIHSVAKFLFEGLHNGLCNNLAIEDALRNVVVLVLNGTEADFLKEASFSIFIFGRLLNKYKVKDKEFFLESFNKTKYTCILNESLYNSKNMYETKNKSVKSNVAKPEEEDEDTGCCGFFKK